MVLSKGIAEILHSAKSDKVIRNVIIVVFSLCLGIAVVFSPFSALLILLSYLSGIVVSSLLLKYEAQVKNSLQHLVHVFKIHFISKNGDEKNICAICSGPGCSRHQANTRTPWKSIYIQEELNTSIEDFFNKILNEFIVSWYSLYTNDASFIYELKHSIRYATAAAVKRFLELDIGKIITNKLVPCSIKHVDDYLCMIQIAELKSSELNKIVVDYLGKRLHIAASSRSNELKYLQNLANALTERLLPAENLKCKNVTFLLREIIAGWVLLPLMDVLADPYILNELIILLTTYKSKGHVNKQESTKNVEFLHNFGKRKFNEVALAVDLQTIIKDPTTLYSFMQYLKKEGVVHLLQFCLNIEEFNADLLQPDLTKRQLEDLHTKALMLYKDYLDPKSDNFIGCSPEIVGELRSLLDEGVYSVAKLQTAEPLYKASEFVFNMLENDWLPLFYHSVDFYAMIGGPKASAGYSKTSTTRMKRGAEAQLSSGKFTNPFGNLGKIKGVLQVKQPIEGSIYPHESRIIENDPAFVEDFSECSSRNLNTWRVFIPAREAHYGTKANYYHIEVHRTDSVREGETKLWTVLRRDQDFYTLKSKLIEFHGESEICNSPLPTRRAALTLDERKAKYEEFLRRLLVKPLLKGSDLLYTFLTAKQDFTFIVTTTMSNAGLENIYQSVAYKLRKEKGQHLDSFLETFFNSSGRQKNIKIELAEMGDEINTKEFTVEKNVPKTFENWVFGDNFGAVYKRDMQGSSSSINPSGITESLFYLLKHIFRVSDPILKFFVAICSVAQPAVESLGRMLIERKIKSALKESTLAFLITELQGVIFGKSSPLTIEQRKKRQEEAFKLLENSVPNSCIYFFGKDFKAGLLMLLKIVQNPLYNKQLAYSLIDIIIGEMYPELDTSDEFY